MRRDALQGERGGGEVIDPGGYGQRGVLVHQRIIGVTVDALGCGDPVADGEPGNSVAHRFHRAGGF
ncbi:hypothetical protein QFZ36_004098 [Pseudarthrobacter siccitolerans]|uniref:Uncharacterized protein n=1 Tax=Pseudarthrobacter siccitolerans TaxID=861266 RepID=A0ABU0PS38_9MICC|nr:hypothetical protein [Pseudarthrobacter siccitolerans]